MQLKSDSRWRLEDIEKYVALRKLFKPFLGTFDTKKDNEQVTECRNSAKKAAIIKFECRAVQVVFLPMCRDRRAKLDKLEAELSGSAKVIPSEVVCKPVWEACGKVEAKPGPAAPAASAAAPAAAAAVPAKSAKATRKT